MKSVPVTSDVWVLIICPLLRLRNCNISRRGRVTVPSGMGGGHDPEHAERLEAEAPEEFLRRREFLQRAALTGGLAISAATTLDAGTLVANAAKRQVRSSPLPSPRNAPIATIVVLMMENRSFDHYL